MLRQIPRIRPIHRCAPCARFPMQRLRYSMKTDEAEEWTEEDDLYTPDLTNLPARWEKMNDEERGDITFYLEERQELPWDLISSEEKKAAYYLAYGAWGPRHQVGLNATEVLFRFMSSSILFSVLGLSVFMYSRDKKKVKELEALETADTSA